MNRMLVETARKHQPELAFFVLYQDQFMKSAVRRIAASGRTKTLNWFCDDHWRFDLFSRYWAPCFSWVVTTYRPAMERYRQIGVSNVILSQWACNDQLFKPSPGEILYDVSFVGQAHGERRQIMDCLKQAGIQVHAFGQGWDSGRVETEQMAEIFSRSRINLNFTSASQPLPSEELIRYCWKCAHRMRDSMLGPELMAMMHGVSKLKSRLRPPKPALQSDAAASQGLPAQIKGRNFEVPGCGGFLLTGPAEDLDHYFQIGSEIEVFADTDDLITKIRHHLAHEERRRAIARAGFARIMREHTYRRRFADIFSTMGLPAESKVVAGELTELD